jgi:hypothetical protein
MFRVSRRTIAKLDILGFEMDFISFVQSLAVKTGHRSQHSWSIAPSLLTL